MDDAGSGIRGDAEVTYAGNRTDASPGLGRDIGDNGSAIVGARSRMDARLSLGGDARDNRSAIVGAGNRMGAGLGLKGDARDDRSTVGSTKNRTGIRLALGRDVRDDRSVVVDDGLAAKKDGSATENNELAADDDKLATRDDGLAADNNRSAIEIDKRIDVDDGSDTRANNQSDSNRPDADWTIGDIRADLIQDFNNGILLVFLAKLSRIIFNKHPMDSPIRILTNVINNPFRDMSPLSMALPYSPLLLSLPAPGNSGNIPTTIIYSMLIYTQDLVPS